MSMFRLAPDDRRKITVHVKIFNDNSIFSNVLCKIHINCAKQMLTHGRTRIIIILEHSVLEWVGVGLFVFMMLPVFKLIDISHEYQMLNFYVQMIFVSSIKLKQRHDNNRIPHVYDSKIEATRCQLIKDPFDEMIKPKTYN